MADLSISERIFAAWNKAGKAERPRTYLGASSIGHECDMWLWLNFRGICMDNFDGRMYRLFDRGQREEEVFCSDLRRIGCEVRDRDESTGSQFSVSAFGGHFGGHLDGICRGLEERPGEWLVTEFKTHSSSSFKKLVKEKVRKAKPMHYAQMQTYMGLTGLKNALYMAVDKDNDDLHCEIVPFDKATYDQTMARAKHIIDTAEPVRCANRPDDYRCKACAAREVCWHTTRTFVDQVVPETCRTCCHATADTEHDGAQWKCALGHSCTTDKTGCSDHLLLPVFVKGSPVDGDEHGIVYEYGDGKRITIGKSGISVGECKKFGPDEADAVLAVVKEIPGATVATSNTLKVKYSGDSYETYFRGPVEHMREYCASSLVVDWSSPMRTEEHDGVRYFEYSPGILVSVDGDVGTVIGEKPPF